MDIDILKTELTSDPLTRGYSGMDDAAAAADLNTLYRKRNKERMSGSEILNEVVKSEFNALSAGDQQRMWDILHLGEVNPFGIEADMMIDIFGGGSSTISALQAARRDDISRGDELGIGLVKPGHVEEARR